MKKLILFLMLAAFTSCLTVKRIERNCEQFAKVCATEIRKDISYRDTIIYRTDTLRVPLPVRDTLYLTDTLIVENNIAWLPPVSKTFGIIGVDARVESSILNLKAYLTDSTILYPRRDTIPLPGAIKEVGTVNLVKVRFIPKFYKFTFWLFIAACAAAVGGLVWKYRKFG